MPSYPDKSLNFGMQNFFYMDKDEGGATYYYYGFQNRKSAVLIMRTNTSQEDAFYYIDIGEFNSIWNNRASFTYKQPKDLVDPRFEC